MQWRGFLRSVVFVEGLGMQCCIQLHIYNNVRKDSSSNSFDEDVLTIEELLGCNAVHTGIENNSGA